MRIPNCKTEIQLSKQNGFSLPELIIVLLVISILVVIALPKTIRQLQLYRLDTSVSVIGNKLMETRMNAIKRNRTAWLRLNKVAKTTQIKSTNSVGATIDVGFPERFPQGMDLDAYNSIDISFDSMGRLSTTAPTITILETNSNKRKNITISPAGKISVGQMY